jgi:hypothetical protein
MPGFSCAVSISGSLFLTSDNAAIPLLNGGTTGISDSRDPGEAFIRVYPNPVSTNSGIRFEYPGKGTIRIKQFDAAGKLVKDIQANGPCTEIVPASGLPSGICIYSVKSVTKMRYGRLILQ